MNGANHRLDGLSTYPFGIFGGDWARAVPPPGELPRLGDTIVGHDVWIGYDSLILPGVRIGDEAMAARLQAVAWWDWSPQKITRHLERVSGADAAA